MSTKRNSAGLPADRRDNLAKVSMGSSAIDSVSLKGSGYDAPFSKSGSKVKGAGQITSNKAGNGGRKSTQTVVGKTKPGTIMKGKGR